MIAVVSVLVHLAVLDVLPHGSMAPADDAVDEPLRATLMPPVAPVAPVAPEPMPVQPVAKPLARPRLVRPSGFVPRALDPMPRVAVSSTPASPAETSTSHAPIPDPPAIVPAPAPPPAPTATAPQSARLSYKVLSIDPKNDNPIYGIGSIDWSIADGRYRSDIVAAVDLLLVKVNLLASHSEGAVTPQGLAPDRYTESPRRRAMVATSFNRDARQSITFSASSATVPLMPGAQDRLSVLFQIGALLLANGTAVPGGRIDIPVAGVRGDVDTWSFDVIGDETVTVGKIPVPTTHLRRTPRPGTNDRTIDVWVAVQNGGYPGRVLYTEPNGNTIDMTLEKIGALP